MAISIPMVPYASNKGNREKKKKKTPYLRQPITVAAPSSPRMSTIVGLFVISVAYNPNLSEKL